MSPSEYPSKFSSKLKELVGGRVKTEIDAAARLRKGTVSLILHRGNVPAPTECIQLARALGVCPIWLMDESDTRIEPVWAGKNPLLKDATDAALSSELKRRLGDAAANVDSLVDRFEQYPWEQVAAWLLSRFVPPIPTSSLVLAGIDLYKRVETPSARLRILGENTTTGERRVRIINGGVPDIIDTGELLARIDAIREAHPGILAFSYYLLGFDEDWHAGQITKYGDHPTPDWDDRRAWLMAQLVSNDTLAGIDLYDPIRERLREMNYLTDDGDARDFGYSKDGLGDFDLPEPN
ncbi:MAG: hypothetical protein AAGA29_07830 [Planctomycetota bacterium]